MDAAGAHEVHFPALLPREPYEATGRWEEYGDGIFRLQDRKGADYLLAPTHEEVFTLLVKDLYSSYKDLPLSIYQIQDKYRDEARPRAGLLRGREFTMKDAYSFDYTDAGLDVSLPGAARRLRAHLHAPRSRVRDRAGRRRRHGRLAQRGVPAPDRRSARTPSCARPAATRPTSRRSRPSRRRAACRSTELTPAEVLDTPDTPTIADARRPRERAAPAPDGRAWTAADTLKNVVLALTHLDGTRELVVVGAARRPRGRPASAPRWRSRRPRSSRRPRPTSRSNPLLVKGYIGPWSRDRARCSARSRPPASGTSLDPRVVDGTGWITGANDRRQARLRPRRRPRLRAPTAPSRSPRCAPATPPPTAPARSNSRAAWRSATSSSSAASTPRRSASRCSTRTASSSPSRWARTASA